MTTVEKFTRWVAAQDETPVEIIEGVHAAKHLRLDADGLKARGWTDLPRDLEPKDGDIWAGGYLEERGIYESPVFQTKGEEPRTLHLGVDVFAPAGTLVYAPLEGWVHSFRVNDGELDYGPTIILQHETEDGLIFWTLYGHLSEGSLFGLDEGDCISRGQVLAELGDHQVNGGWAPHLHFQIMLDIQGREGDFPGVCKVSEKAKWKEICPSPYALLGLNLL